ncbi:MAG: DegV family protein [Lachnospiraceae bacterium]
MGDYILSCCSTADLSKEHFHKRDIQYVCFHFTLGDREYMDDLGESVPPAELYRRMVAGEDTKTSQVSVAEYEALFEKNLKQGKDILHVTLSTGISGTYNSACVARENLSERYPDRKIYVVDSLGASSGYGLIMETLADLRDAGMGIDELHQWIESHKLELHHWFFSTDLTFYIRGGRISRTAGFIGSVMGICPLLNMDNEGKLIPREKIRTKKKVIRRIVDKMEENARDGRDYSGKCFLSQSECMEDAREVAALVEERFPKLDGKVQIFPIGATIGSHTGPGTIALFFWGGERKN